MQPKPDLDRRTALLLLGAITALGAALRFYGLSWGAPYYHFHIDEHFVLGPADLLRRSGRLAAESPKFFMYSPLVMYFINGARAVFEAVAHPIDLTVPRDEVTYMVLGRAISATLSTATIPLVYAIGTRLSGRVAGLLSAFFLCCAVLHLRDSHFATTDIGMVFFCVVTLWCAVRLAETGETRWLVGSGLGFGFAILCKYTGLFTLGFVGLAYFLAPGRPTFASGLAAWVRWVCRGIVPIIVGLGVFLLLDPLAWQYFGKFQSDIKEWVVDPLTGTTKPIWAGNFSDVRVPELYWFTNLLWWGLGPFLEVLALLGIVWLLVRWDKRAAIVAVYPLVYFLSAGRTSAPFVRYAIPLMPAMALSAGALAGDLLARPGFRRLSRAVVLVTVVATGLYALAYMNVYRQPDSRLQASAWLLENVPPDAHVLIEPSHNTPPMGSYLTAMDFNRDYVLWGPPRTNPDRHDYYQLHTLDAYNALFKRGPTDDDRRNYIAGRLALADWIVMDDYYVQVYQHLPAPQHAVMKQYYQDLFAGKLGFALVKTFKVYPSLFGWSINDDGAEMTFRHFDHPRIFIFRRFAAR